MKSETPKAGPSNVEGQERQTTPPQVRDGNPQAAASNSTPEGKGTAAYATNNTETRTNSPNVLLIKEDLRDALRVPFLSFVKSLLMVERHHDGNDTKPLRAELSPDALAQYGAEQLESLVTEAVNWCNGPLTGELRKMKENLKEMLSTKVEKDRYHPLSVALNAILVQFSGNSVSDAAFLFVVNDPAIITSTVMSDEAPRGTMRKPDLIALTLCRLKKIVSVGVDGYSGFAKILEEGADVWKDARKNAQENIGWPDVHNPFEIKVEDIIDCTRMDGPYEVADILPKDHKQKSELQAGPTGSTGSATTSKASARKTSSQSRSTAGTTNSNNLKRKSSTPRGSSNKKQKFPPLSPSTTVTTDVQCAYYGLELLRSRWDRTHSVVFLLVDNKLSLKWYDPQGCIETEPIDIVEQLPLLVATMVLFQRFGTRMRGIAPLDLKATVNGREHKYDIPNDTSVLWELKGRRPVVAKPVAKGTADERTKKEEAKTEIKTRSQTKAHRLPDDLKNTFFKFSWREEQRDGEGDIISCARERAEKHLGKFAKDVTNHLPDVLHYKAHDKLSTKFIRQFAGVGIEGTQGSRVPCEMLSKEMKPLDELPPDDFFAKIWGVIRCHFLLWKIGIAHGDISFNNLMVKSLPNGHRVMVLNDYDLAAIMAEGEKSPSKKGYERTGTKPFMALDLLYSSDGSVFRLYRHDLESILWCIAWYCKEEKTWTEGSHDQVAKEKGFWLLKVNPARPPDGIRPGAEVFWRPVIKTFKTWINDMAPIDGKADHTDRELLEMIDQYLPRQQEYKTWDWMDFSIHKGARES
ncbi:hypothetical protein FA15DRAFT_123242 [Coprinopsis marcescibilis]|uniref:Fungal-type protein kinase domain-containing protein n=1 Tax=Coprinopsis marcescibilis TaxID=230819 RepID=A0A5C3KKP1_COPMA|nr:hypothetical protein FA15DRAFT_123242 [Coprinopsis marcescibilis]